MIIMVENGNVIVELTEREVFLTSALMLLWRVMMLRDMVSPLLDKSDPITKEAIKALVMSDFDGSYNQMLMKYRNAAVTGIDGKKNL